MEDPKKELLKEIANLFEDYEEVYAPGEWEAFVSAGKRPRWFLRNWMQVAAIFFLILSICPFGLNDIFQARTFTAYTAGQHRAPNTVTSPLTIENLNKNRHESIDRKTDRHQGAAMSLNAVANGKINSIGSSRPADSIWKEGQLAALSGAKLSSEAGISAVKNDTLSKAKKLPLSTAEFLAEESKNTNGHSFKKEVGSKWGFGLALMPTATGSNTSIAAGFTTAYKLSDKLAVSSGISLLQLQSGKDITPSGGDNEMSLMSISNKTLLAVNSNIKAIDIPVGLVYQVGKHFYTSAGISFLSILSDQQNSTFNKTSQVNRMATSTNGTAFSYKAVETSTVNESTTQGTLQGSSSLGFFNFSVGRTQNIFGKYSVQIEPFIKIPVGKLSADQLQLMNSGVKFQLAF